ncbi:hypothetical protein COOONC_15542 [Cooperia oncophora]
MSILIFMVSDKMPSTSSFIPLIGRWQLTYASSMSAKKGGFGSFGSQESLANRRAGKRCAGRGPEVLVGRFVRMEMPLLMKQAYAQKAREDKLRRAQEGRKQSLWQRVYKVAREQAQLRKISSAQQKLSGNGNMSSPDIQQLQVPKKSCTINTDVTCIDEQRLF